MQAETKRLANEVLARPILFSGPMIRAILENRKTMTRRIIKPDLMQCLTPEDEPEVFVGWCPYGQPRSRLWVRETWGIYTESWTDYGWEGDGIADMPIPVQLPASTMHRKYHVVYKADGYEADPGEKWRPSIHMPRWASRITLEVTDVRVEKLQDISEEDAIAEGLVAWTSNEGKIHYGISRPDVWEQDPRLTYKRLWDSINASRGYSWQSNPWIWSVSFARCVE